MNSRMTHLAGRRVWRMAAVLVAVLLLALLVGAPMVLAADPITGLTDVACMGMPANACTSNRVSIAAIDVVGTPACLLDPNDGLLYADVTFKARVQSTSAETYDVGLWIALTGGNAQTDTTNTCYRGILTPIENGSPFNADGGPFRDLENDANDYCGDTLETDGPVFAYIDEMRVQCVDGSPPDNVMDSISTCTSWDNNATGTCNDPTDALPSTTAHCFCGTTAITPGIPLQQIVVRKVTDPSPDPYGVSFDFTVAGTNATPNPPNYMFSLGDGDGWNSGPLNAGGTYSVVEATPPTGWTQTSVVCTDGMNTYNAAGFTLPANRTVECTFTNTIQRGNIQVDKVTNPSGATDSFGMALTGGPAGHTVNETFSLTDGSPVYDITILPTTPTGTYDISETSVPSGWAFVGGSCDNLSPINAVTVAPGQTVICTLYNAIPTSVNMTSFTATGSRTAITLKWTTGNEVDNMGFNVLRATKPRGAKTQLNATLIESIYTGLPKGANYDYRDSTVKKGATYYYWIEDVDIYGHKTLHGPVKATAR